MINYEKERNRYKPQIIKTLLIGEAFPPKGKSYFYVPERLSLGGSIENDRGFPSTIFNHYFNKRPESIEEYEKFLIILKERGIFLIDIIEKPIKIRDNKENEYYLISQIPYLRDKIKSMGIELPEEKWIFLLARTSYKHHLSQHFPLAQKIRWKDFRMTHDKNA